MMRRGHRYVVLKQGIPVFTTDECDDLVSYRWGRHLKYNYVVYDYERPSPLDNANLIAWIAPLYVAAGQTPPWG